MPIKLSDKCDECGKSIKTVHLYQSKTLCTMCYRRQFVIISSLPKSFEEQIDVTVAFTLSMTKSQKKVLDERVKYLFPNKNNCRTKYLRMLILGDIENSKRGNDS